MIISVTLCEMILGRTPEVTSTFPGRTSFGSVVSGSLEEIYRVESNKEFFVLELLMSDIISVMPEDTGLVDMAELGCSPMLVTNEIVVYVSEGIRVDEVIVSCMPGEMVLNRTHKVPCIP